ncbi:MAG: class I adenylate-forming enzyme family protein [Pseudomonadota bacterium]
MPHSGPSLDRRVVVSDILEIGLQLKPDEPALVSTEVRWTWRELDVAARRLAGNYLGLGLRPGDRVASLMPNRVVLVVHYLACLKAGLVATPLNYRYMPPEVDHALRVSEASVILVHRERAGDVAASELAEHLPKGIIWYDDPGQPASGGLTFDTLMDPDSAMPDLPTPAPDLPAFVLFTSGSTGNPKGVTHTHKTIGNVLASTVVSFHLTPDDIMLPGLSISHMGGIGFGLAALAAGARVDIARTYVDEELLRLLRETRPTILGMLPAFLFRLIRDHDAKPEDFTSLRMCLSGGDKVSHVLEDEVGALTGLKISTNYAMTEIGFATLCYGKKRRDGSVGLPCAGFELSIRDDDGIEVPSGEKGRLFVRSPANMIGYWGNPEATATTLVDGWLDTGDVMYVDDDGYYWFAGRKSQIIIHDGSNISPQEIEEVLLEHETVELAGVVGVDDLVHGENVRAYVTLKDDVETFKEQELIDFARARIGYKAPEVVVVLDEMPFNATGKVDRVTLKAMAARDHEQAPAVIV